MSPRALLVAGLISTLVGEKAIADQDWYQMVQLPKPAHEVLPSGLQIVWFEDRNVPLVDLVLFMPIGFSSDPDGASGAGALVGGLLERGTKTQSATDISRAMDQLGASSMVSIDDDFGIVGIHGLSSDFFELARLLRTISIEADFPEVEIKRTKDLMKESIARMADHPGPLADLAFSRLIASGTPYARGRLQSEKQLMSISRNTLKQFHAAMLQPQKAVLLVIGKLPEADRDADDGVG